MILFALNRTLCLLGPSQIALVGDIVIVDNRWCTCFGSTCTDSASTFSGLFSVAGTLHLLCCGTLNVQLLCTLNCILQAQIVHFAQTPGKNLSCLTSKI